MRGTAIVPIVALAACGGVAGCGSGAESEVKDVVQAYAKAITEGDGRTACALVTDELRRQAVEATGGVSCEETVEEGAAQLTAEERDMGQIDGFDRVTITKSGASVEVADFPIEFLLVQTGNGWKISTTRAR
jgi:hypothetical protein